MINHYCFKGRKSFRNFRVLIAGCGIGDDLVWLTKQLELYENTSVAGIDLSGGSLEISRKRAELYGLGNVELHRMCLLDLTPEAFQPFDFILCGGVLHHLEDPSKGLTALKNVLKSDGSMLLMVYGKIGRTHIYQMQDLLRLVNRNVDDIKQKINNFKVVYNHLPESNLFRKNEDITPDHKASESGIADMLLHPRDRAYTIPELFDWIEECGLNFIEFGILERDKYKYRIPNIDYTGIGQIERCAINELYFGDIFKHTFYVSGTSDTTASVDNQENIPVWVGLDYNQCAQLFEYLGKTDDYSISLKGKKKELLVPLRERDVKYNYGKELNLKLTLNPDTVEVIKRIDNRRSLGEIFEGVAKSGSCSSSYQELVEESTPVLNKLIDNMIIVLKHPESDLALAKWKP